MVAKKKYVFLVFYFLYVFVGFACKTSVKKNKLIQITNATYTAYNTAMGKGKGIIFRFVLANKNNEDVCIDSIYINNKLMPFVTKKNGNDLAVEINYLVNKNEPMLQANGSTSKVLDIDDKIINRLFYPSWIIITLQGEKNKLSITNYTEIKSNY